MKQILPVILLFCICTSALQAQELNAKLSINTQKIESANKEMFTSLERGLSQLLNDQKWTSLTYSKEERIDCTFSITVNEIVGENTYSADIQMSVRRPVYNSSYITSLFNFRDTQFEFSYMQGQSLDFNSINVDNNIVAVIAYYAYVIIGLDSDSFSLNGGSAYFSKAMDIANTAQSLNTRGWEPFSGKNNNRYDLAIALTEESSGSFHSMWYTYHRMGLDEMAANSSRGRIRIMESINDLQKLYDNRPSSPLLALVAESKLDEIIRVCSQETAEEKQNIKSILSRLFPTKVSIISNGFK